MTTGYTRSAFPEGERLLQRLRLLQPRQLRLQRLQLQLKLQHRPQPPRQLRVQQRLPLPPLQAVRRLRPDRRLLPGRRRHRGRARLRRQGPRVNWSIYRLSVVRGPDKRIIITTGMAPIHDRIL
jgi:hypothetical protein